MTESCCVASNASRHHRPLSHKHIAVETPLRWIWCNANASRSAAVSRIRGYILIRRCACMRALLLHQANLSEERIFLSILHIGQHTRVLLTLGSVHLIHSQRLALPRFHVSPLLALVFYCGSLALFVFGCLCVFVSARAILLSQPCWA